jgi:hypothetical protein
MVTSPVYVIGDIHGQYSKLIGLLKSVPLVDDSLAWIGDQAALWCLGDFFDRGPDGIKVVSLWMRLQKEAAAAGGYVGALIGNHDVTLLSAHLLGYQPSTGAGGTFLEDWYRNGGVTNDLRTLTPEHIEWLSNLPAMVHVADRLFVHADSMLYTGYGSSIDEVNIAFYDILHNTDIQRWDTLLDHFSEHRAFFLPDGPTKARQFLDLFGGRQIIHGHTPAGKMTKQYAQNVHSAYVYADGLCVNVDGGMYVGGQGFLYRIPDDVPR